MRLGVGLVVIVILMYSDDPSLNPSDIYRFFWTKTYGHFKHPQVQFRGPSRTAHF